MRARGQEMSNRVRPLTIQAPRNRHYNLRTDQEPVENQQLRRQHCRNQPYTTRQPQLRPSLNPYLLRRKANPSNAPRQRKTSRGRRDELGRPDRPSTKLQNSGRRNIEFSRKSRPRCNPDAAPNGPRLRDQDAGSLRVHPHHRRRHRQRPRRHQCRDACRLFMGTGYRLHPLPLGRQGRNSTWTLAPSTSWPAGQRSLPFATVSRGISRRAKAPSTNTS